MAIICRFESMESINLPRLELYGAELLSFLTINVMKKQSIKNCSIHLWPDSTIVLAWLKKHPSWWNTYVANRSVSVASESNPADLGTRGCSSYNL